MDAITRTAAIAAVALIVVGIVAGLQLTIPKARHSTALNHLLIIALAVLGTSTWHLVEG